MNFLNWFKRPVATVPHLAEVRGLTRKMAERKLRTLGYSIAGAKRFYWENKGAIRGE